MNVVIINLTRFMMKYTSIVEVIQMTVYDLIQVFQEINKYPK